MKIVTISPQGQITIPKELRTKINTKKWLMEIEENNIILKPIKIEKKYAEEFNSKYVAYTNTYLNIWEYWEDETYQMFYKEYSRKKILAAGDIALIPYPLDSKRINQLRPIVIIKIEGKNIMALPITRKKLDKEEIQLCGEDLEDGLIEDSYVRYKKILTIHLELIKQNVAEIKKEKLKEILDKCSSIFK